LLTSFSHQQRVESSILGSLSQVRWERSAKSDKQAPSHSLATFHIWSFETRPRNPLMHGSRQSSIVRELDKYLIILSLALLKTPLPAPKPYSKSNSERSPGWIGNVPSPSQSGAPLPLGSRTLVTRLPDSRTIGFSRLFPQNVLMRRFINKTISCRRPLRRLYLQGIILLACSLTLLADTPTLLRSVPAAGCYCHCAESHLRGGCVKMCDTKRYVSRWRATKCAKPHMRTPTHNSHAGPRFPHPDRAEHAQLW